MWQFWMDRGGTFTDCIGRSPEGELHVVKVLSSDVAPLVAIRQVLGLRDSEPIPPCELRLGTTVATNALLERRGRPVALAITRGFGDLLAIGTQARRELFALAIEPRVVLHQEKIEIDARAAADGSVLEIPDEERLLAKLTALRARVDSIAVVVMNGFRAPELERAVGTVARRAGFRHVALSHELSAEIGLLARGDTAVLDAYLTPLCADYLAGLERELPGSRIRVMQSSGELAETRAFRGPAAVASGPAAGVVACARIAAANGVRAAIGFDMGGTSTDVCRVAGEPERIYEHEVAGVRVRAPMLALHTVAAGGGSICRVDAGRLVVGPESAGASPGPLAYGDPRARALTVTDVNVALGRVVGDRFPMPLRGDRVRPCLDELARDAGMSAEELADGFVRVATARMSEAIRQISAARGYDPREHVLIAFGGAAGQHAAMVARELGIDTVVFHPLAGVLSALGMGMADVGWHGERDGGRVPLADGIARAHEMLDELEAQGRAGLEADGFPVARQHSRRLLSLRYRGTDTPLTVAAGAGADEAAVRDRFTRAHARLFGYERPGAVIELCAARVEARGLCASWHEGRVAVARGPLPVERETDLWLGGRFERVPVIRRERLGAGHRVDGPALILDSIGTIVVDSGFSLVIDGHGVGWLRDVARADARIERGSERDPVSLELFHNRFMSIAEQMGHNLQRTACSTNIRERLDFSCAVFDARGELVANAPHIPVHLGAMEQSVKALIAATPSLCDGEAYATNDPAAGGSHLPDITVIAPVYHQGELFAFVASRGHHADVGGITPGSMPAGARTLAEEGVVLRGLRVVRAGVLDEALLRRALAAPPCPARDPDTNVADISAQLAANRRGADLLAELCAVEGLARVSAYMRHLQDYAAERVSRAIMRLSPGERRLEDALDDGSPVCVTVRVRHDPAALEIDFAGTGAELADNLNAPRAVSTAAILYVLRLLVGEPIPLASGCLRPVTIRIPPRSLLDPGPTRAIAGGNVETSQRVVDVLLGALGAAAASQGTMNNVSFGTDRWGYYETLGGGSGATACHDGASAVQVHMTNTRITDAEVIESRFPVRLWRFAIRRGSRGAGAHRGGDGLVREIEALAPLAVSILSERRTRAPFGLFGGEPGMPGRNRIVRGGVDEVIAGKANVVLEAGDRLVIETPGGGGYGPPDSTT
jgi:5-oxoprolinase (ATP-hydrolysing)